MAARTSWFGLILQGIISRLGTLETQVGEVTNPEVYTTKSAIRGITGYSDEDPVLCNENQYIYIFDSSSTLADNDDNVLCPDDITPPDPGRWIRNTSLALKDHNHDAVYNKLITTPTQNRFLYVNAAGQVIESTYHANSWAAYSHAHTNYVTTTQFSEFTESLATLSEVVEDKMDKLSPTAGQMGEILIVATGGVAALSGNKITDLSTKNQVINIPDDETGYVHDTESANEPKSMQVCNSTGRVLGPGQVDVQKELSEETDTWEITVISLIGELPNAKLSYV